MTGFYFHPFNGDLNSSTYVPNHLLLYAGGSFLGLPFTLSFIVLALKYRSPVMFPFIVSGSYGFLSTGIWMIKSMLSPETNTDYTYMIDLGFPSSIMITIGVVYFSFGILSRIFFLPLAGIDYKINYRTRLAIYLTGIIPWYILHGLYNIVFNNAAIVVLAYLILTETFFALIESSLSFPLQRKFRFFRIIHRKTPTNQHFVIIIITVLLLYTIAIIVNSLFTIET